jgi:SAM-dependent methyltransferase
MRQLLGRLARLPLAGLRRLRWRVGAWSKDSDREYHDHLYAATDYDPFRSDYPGYVTIRRFADHAGRLMPASGRVLDLGCGPGEITCELARRHPAVSFLGIDHSAQAIERARTNVARLGLANIEFRSGDAEQLVSNERFGLVMMFDAFHHLEQPDHVLAWMRAKTTRCLLIEPAGTPSGRWARDLDLDWLLLDLANVRERLEAIAGRAVAIEADDQPTNVATDAPKRGEGAVERRYAVDDFARFFAGWTLNITGTVAGFDRYPARPHARGPLRRVAGEAVYEFVRVTEDLLVTSGRDGAAKHWVIAATSETDLVPHRIPASIAVPQDTVSTGTSGSCDVSYADYEGPVTVRSDSQFRPTVVVVNNGWDRWRSDGVHPVHVSYHWLDAKGAEVVDFNGARSQLPRELGPGDRCRVQMIVDAPPKPGRYVLAIDLVREGVTWFSETGAPWKTVPVTVENN